MPISINQQIKDNAISWKEWRHHDKAKEAYEMFDKVNTVLFCGESPQPVIGFDDTVKNEGHYHWEGDDISLSFHVDIPTNLSRLELIVASIHNTVHVSNETLFTSVTWYHKKAFHDAMWDFGIDVAKDGTTLSFRKEFVDVLRSLGEGEIAEKLLADFEVKNEDNEVNEVNEDNEDNEVNEEVPQQEPNQEPEHIHTLTGALPPIPTISVTSVPAESTPHPAPTGKMKKWVCLCTTVRCATKLNSLCLDCNSKFSLGSV